MENPQAPGWYPDPTGRFLLRYWSGQEWTSHVTDDQGNRHVDGMDLPANTPNGIPQAAPPRQSTAASPATAPTTTPGAGTAAVAPANSRQKWFIGGGIAAAFVLVLIVVAVAQSSSGSQAVEFDGTPATSAAPRTNTATTTTARPRTTTTAPRTTSPPRTTTTAWSQSNTSNGPIDVYMFWDFLSYSEQLELCNVWLGVSDSFFISELIAVGFSYSEASELVDLLWAVC